MIEVIGVTFKKNGKIYYSSSTPENIKIGINLIVKTDRGLQYVTVVTDKIQIDSEKLKEPLFEFVRIANHKDNNQNKKNIEDAKEALKKCKELAKKYNLNMAILEANYTFDRGQLLFTFLSDNRIDFRKLAKDLATIYKTRIELRQIGIRDKAKEIGGFGTCGRELCCSKFLCDFNSVSINMAKNQNIALNPNKINGACGRLLCCLKYEDKCYKELSKNMPKVGKMVETKLGVGKVISIDILKQKYRVNIENKGIIEVDLNEDN